jgi:hypothetical protein
MHPRLPQESGKHQYQERCCLAGAGLRLASHVDSLAGVLKNVRLDRRTVPEAGICHRMHDNFRQVKVMETGLPGFRRHNEVRNGPRGRPGRHGRYRLLVAVLLTTLQPLVGAGRHIRMGLLFDRNGMRSVRGPDRT